MPRVRTAIVGGGFIAGKKHLPAFIRQKDKAELVAICDSNLEAAQRTAKSFGIRKSYPNISEMLFREKPDLVDICTPPQTHARLAVEALRHGCHVLIEKPMALTVSECDAIIDASKESGRKVCVAHSNLFYQPFRKARDIVRRGGLGEFCGMRIFLSTPTDYMTAHEGHWAHRLPGGVVGETGPHAVYMSLPFVNPIREVNVHGTKLLDYPWSRFEDYRIELIGERAVSSIVLSYATDQWMAQVDIFCRRGILVLDLEGMTSVRHRRARLKPIPIGLSLLGESTQIGYNLMLNCLHYVTGRLESTHSALVREFLRSILTGCESPVPAEEGRETVRVMNLIAERLDGGSR